MRGAGPGRGGAGGGAPRRGGPCRGWTQAAARRGSAARRAPRVGRGVGWRPGVHGALHAAGPARQDGSRAPRPRGGRRASSAAASPWGRCERQPRLRSGGGTVARASSLPKGRAPHCRSDRRVTDSVPEEGRCAGARPRRPPRRAASRRHFHSDLRCGLYIKISIRFREHVLS